MEKSDWLRRNKTERGKTTTTTSETKRLRLFFHSAAVAVDDHDVATPSFSQLPITQIRSDRVSEGRRAKTNRLTPPARAPQLRWSCERILHPEKLLSGAGSIVRHAIGPSRRSLEGMTSEKIFRKYRNFRLIVAVAF